ncbi:DMT family transporter [Dongia sedimenti]|uniref:EamA family transporter n=1 Tax=Dongia sedimenti TaxID=3064282 RepID=A0ABU0YN16_9PROT|nr:EamA family transporter [Rhodospirillaceae bacterium R-7]
MAAARSDVLSRTLSPTMSLVVIVGLSMIWGYHWAVMKIGLYYCGGLTYTAIRCIIAAPVMLLIVKLRGGSIRLKAPKAAIIVGIVQTAGNFGLGAIAVKFGEAGKSAVLTYTMPFWVLLLGFLFLGERAGPRRWIAATLAGIGTLLVALAGGVAQLMPVALAILAGICWASGVLLYQYFHKKNADEPTVFAAWQLLVGGISMGIFIPFVPGEHAIQWTPAFIGAMTYTTVLATIVAVYLWFLLISRLEAGMVALGILLAPAIGLASSWIQLAERPSLLEATGLGTILFAIAFFAWAEWRRSRAVKTD